MSFTGFRLTLLLLDLFIFIGVINSRPIRLGQHIVRTSKRSSVNAVGDQTHGLGDHTRSGPDNDNGYRAPHKRRLACRDVKHAVAKAPAPQGLSSGMMSSHYVSVTGESFFDDYASAICCGICGDRFGDLSWIKLLSIFLITLGTMIGLIIVYWAVLSCCMMRSDDQDCCCNCSNGYVSSKSSCCNKTATSGMIIEKSHS